MTPINTTRTPETAPELPGWWTGVFRPVLKGAANLVTYVPRKLFTAPQVSPETVEREQIVMDNEARRIDEGRIRLANAEEESRLRQLEIENNKRQKAEIAAQEAAAKAQADEAETDVMQRILEQEAATNKIIDNLTQPDETAPASPALASQTQEEKKPVLRTEPDPELELVPLEMRAILAVNHTLSEQTLPTDNIEAIMSPFVVDKNGAPYEWSKPVSTRLMPTLQAFMPKGTKADLANIEAAFFAEASADPEFQKTMEALRGQTGGTLVMPKDWQKQSYPGVKAYLSDVVEIENNLSRLRKDGHKELTYPKAWMDPQKPELANLWAMKEYVTNSLFPILDSLKPLKESGEKEIVLTEEVAQSRDVQKLNKYLVKYSDSVEALNELKPHIIGIVKPALQTPDAQIDTLSEYLEQTKLNVLEAKAQQQAQMKEASKTIMTREDAEAYVDACSSPDQVRIDPRVSPDDQKMIYRALQTAPLRQVIKDVQEGSLPIDNEVLVSLLQTDPRLFPTHILPIVYIPNEAGEERLLPPPPLDMTFVMPDGSGNMTVHDWVNAQQVEYVEKLRATVEAKKQAELTQKPSPELPPAKYDVLNETQAQVKAEAEPEKPKTVIPMRATPERLALPVGQGTDAPVVQETAVPVEAKPSLILDPSASKQPVKLVNQEEMDVLLGKTKIQDEKPEDKGASSRKDAIVDQNWTMSRDGKVMAVTVAKMSVEEQDDLIAQLKDRGYAPTYDAMGKKPVVKLTNADEIRDAKDYIQRTKDAMAKDKWIQDRISAKEATATDMSIEQMAWDYGQDGKSIGVNTSRMSAAEREQITQKLKADGYHPVCDWEKDPNRISLTRPGEVFDVERILTSIAVKPGTASSIKVNPLLRKLKHTL